MQPNHFRGGSLVPSKLDAAEGDWPALLQRAPLNTDTSFVGIKSFGLARAYRWLAYIPNTAVLGGLIYVFARKETDFAYFIYICFGILLGGPLLSYALGPFIRAFAIIPILALTACLLARFCDLSPKRAALVAVVFHAYQVVYILAYRAIAASYT